MWGNFGGFDKKNMIFLDIAKKERVLGGVCFFYVIPNINFVEFNAE